MNEVVTAAFVVIGDEILSGRTKDRNIGHLADLLTTAGIDLKEVRVVSDETRAIVEAVNALRARFTYVFTSGGIGPTHDDITADSIAEAFDVACDYDPRAYALLEQHYAARGIPFSDARKRMARMPAGASLIDNPVSVAPGFRIENVYVLAGVPAIFQAMLGGILPTLKGGRKLISKTIRSELTEGTIGSALGKIQTAHPQTAIGSYPKFHEGVFWTEIVVRSADENALLAATKDIEAMIRSLQQNRPPER